MHPVVKSLFKIFVIATVLSIGVNSVYYVNKMLGIRYDHTTAVIKLSIATIVLTAVLFVLQLPALFLLIEKFWKYSIYSFLLYFTGPIMLVILFVFMKFEPTDQLFGQFTGLIYLAVSTVYYYKVTSSRRKKLGRPDELPSGKQMTTRIDPR